MRPTLLRSAAASAIAVVLGVMLPAVALGSTQRAEKTQRDADDIYTPQQVVSAFAAGGINLCAVVICSGLAGPLPGEHSWETNFTVGANTDNVYVVVGRDVAATSAIIELKPGDGQYAGDFQGRFGNVYVEVSRVSPFIHYLTALPIPTAVTAALTRLGGITAPPTSTPQQLICRGLAQHPYGTAPSPTGVTCDGLPGSTDTEYWFDAQLHDIDHVQAAVLYRVFSSSTVARGDWPGFLSEFNGRLILMRRHGSIPGAGYPSALWLTTAKTAADAGGGTTTAILVGQVIVTLETGDTNDTHLSPIETLTREIATHVASVEKTSGLTPPGTSPPTNSAPPTISGSAEQGQTLTVAPGIWAANPTSYAYQWSRCDSSGANCVTITDATGSSYVLTSADAGAAIHVSVTATNAGGSASATSNPTGVVT